jgi:hypothetical protein
MKDRPARALALAMLFGGCLFLIGVVADQRNPALAAPAVLTTPIMAAMADNCLICVNDCGQESGWHYAFDSDETPQLEIWTRNGGAHLSPDICKEYACDTRHGPTPCNPNPVQFTGAELEKLRTSILASDASAVARLMATHQGQIVVNAKRLAVQVLDCKGAAMVHLPISEVMVRSVRQAQRVLGTQNQ